MLAQIEWTKAFTEEKRRIMQHAEDVKKAGLIKDPEQREARIAELESEDLGSVCHLHNPIGWPIMEKGDEGESVAVASGLPRLGLLMQVRALFSLFSTARRPF